MQAGNVIGDPEAEVCTFLEVGLLLAGGISDAATLPLFKAAQLTLAIKKPAPQKKAYKVLSYLFVKRPKMLEQCKTEAVAILLETSSADVAAKRFRLRCMQPVIMLLSREGEAAWCSPSDQPAQAASLIAELVLGIKEVNAKTRTEAYRVLAATAHALHAADPPEHSNNGMPHQPRLPRTKCLNVLHYHKAVELRPLCCSSSLVYSLYPRVQHTPMEMQQSQ